MNMVTMQELGALMSQTFQSLPFFPFLPYLPNNQTLNFVPMSNIGNMDLNSQDQEVEKSKSPT